VEGMSNAKRITKMQIALKWRGNTQITVIMGRFFGTIIAKMLA